jgi:hypothetical protein
MAYKGFIKNAKDFLGYDQMSFKRKTKFWLLIPIRYIKKILIQRRYKYYLKENKEY